MMKKLFLTTMLFISAILIYGQTSSAKNIEIQTYHDNLKQKITTLNLDISNLSNEKITNLKTEYSAWQNKIISINIDYQNKVISIEHTALWQKEEISEMLVKYNIPVNKIISDK
jgi:hypothetical protein